MKAKKNQTQIEQESITYLISVLIKTEHITPNIPINNTLPSWDGEILLYGKKDFSKENLTGRIPVQVKGTEQNLVSNNELKHKLTISDLKNYKNDGGCIYFVIYSDANNEKTIFYDFLLPSDINKILSLKRNKNAKSITHKFLKFPIEADTIVSLLNTFLLNKKQQKSESEYLLDLAHQSVKEMNQNLWQRTKDISSISFSYINTKPKEMKVIFDIPIYLNAKTKGGYNTLLQRFHVHSISNEVKSNVSINNKVFYKLFKFSRLKEKAKITLGKAIDITFQNNIFTEMKPTFHANLNFTEHGTLDERITDNKFMYELCSKKSNDIVFGKGRKISFDNINNILFDSNIFVKRIMFLEHLKKVLDYYGVTEELVFKTLSDDDNQIITNLFFAYENDVTYSNIKEIGRLLKIKIANLNIFLYLDYLKNNKFKVYSFFDMPKIYCALDKYGKYACSQYIVLEKKDLIQCSNINFKVIFDSIVSIPINEQYIFSVNHLLLEAICAYDEIMESPKKQHLYHFIKELSGWLYDKEQSEVNLLNYYQVLKRERKLDRNEQEQLRKIIINGESTIIKIGATILLESFSEARSFWECLTSIEIDDLKKSPNMPIFNLWESNRPDELTFWTNNDNVSIIAKG